ncbi:MAG: DNA polymerase [Proteobacteria bacterium]|nr:DNA polymerase [Pseudomonadota bacterium]NBP14021.1 DNA polymerase [bacterium]
MNALIFDIESDGLLDTTTQIHCLVIHDTKTNETIRYNDIENLNPVSVGVERLKNAHKEDYAIVGHNILGFDIPVLSKLYDVYPEATKRDTLICCRLIWPDIREKDFGFSKKNAWFPKNLIGSHSLKAWGYRIGLRKGEFKESGDFSKWSKEMEDYCVKDVEVTKKLWENICLKKYSQRAIDLETNFYLAISLQEKYGFGFDRKKAEELYVKMAKRRVELEQELQNVFEPSKEKLKSKTYVFFDKIYSSKAEALQEAKRWAKLNNKTQKEASELIKDGKQKEKTIPFNPGSRDEIAQRFKKKYKWEPKEFTPDGKAKVDEAVLQNLAGMGYTEAKPLLEYLLLQKRIGQLAEGNEAWIKMVGPDGRIHGRVNTNGAITGRCTHSKPNIAQVPRVGSEYGKECRELFIAEKGKKLVGADASGLELRCLAHYLARWDGGEYANEIIQGDIHALNQASAGLPTRDDAKTFIYAFLYGAGDEKIGNIIGKGQEEGRRIKREFLNKTPALRYLKDTIDFTLKNRGYLVGLDGRVLNIRSQHSALNTLLQSAGALIMKQATTFLLGKLQKLGFQFGVDYALVAHIHDEMQIECREDIAEQVGQTAVASIEDAGKSFEFKCPLTGEYRIGQNWAETH